MTSHTTITPLNVTATPTLGIGNESKQQEKRCRDIPGVISEDGIRRLDEFSESYAAIHGYVAVVICTCGITFNVLSCVVLTRRHMKNSTNIILAWMSFFSAIKMINYLPFAVYFYIVNDQAFLSRFHTPSLPWICFLVVYAVSSMLLHTISVWLTATLAIFRLIYIRFPSHARHYCSAEKAKFAVCIVTGLSVVLTLPYASALTYDYTVIHNNGNVSETEISHLSSDNSTALRRNSTTVERKDPVETGFYSLSVRSLKIYSFAVWCMSVMGKFVPSITFAILTLALLHAINIAHKKRIKLKSQLGRDSWIRLTERNRTTTLLLVIVVLVSISEIPGGILLLMENLIDCFTSAVYYKLGDILDLVALICTDIMNFFILCSMSSVFRATFVNTFCPTCVTKNTPYLFETNYVSGTSPDLTNVRDSTTAYDTWADDTRRGSKGSLHLDHNTPRRSNSCDTHTTHQLEAHNDREAPHIKTAMSDYGTIKSEYSYFTYSTEDSFTHKESH